MGRVKVHRLLSIVMLLLTNKRIGAQELAERFEVSLRTIYRDLETINAAGIPVVSFSGPNGGYEIMEQYHIDRQIVTLEDLRSIMTALNGLEASLKDPQLHDVIAKVGALITKAEQAKLEESGDELLFNANLWRGKEADSGTISALRRAARFRHVVRFRYVTARGDEEEREAEPVGLAWKGYAWYLHAWCRLRRDFRTFRLTRIRDCRVLEERFAPRRQPEGARRSVRRLGPQVCTDPDGAAVSSEAADAGGGIFSAGGDQGGRRRLLPGRNRACGG